MNRRLLAGNKFNAACTLALCILVYGCASTPKVTNLTPADLYGEPEILTYQDPDTDFTSYRSFSVFPYSLVSSHSEINQIAEKQLLFFLRNSAEFRGYDFVTPDRNPDLFLTIRAMSEYKESYIPPRTVILPFYVPGKTVVNQGTASGTFNFNTIGSHSSYGWGAYSGSTTSTTYIPGYVSAFRYSRPGYTVGHYYPAVAVEAYDARSQRLVWLGAGAGTSDNPDVRISAQKLILRLMKDFPRASQSAAPFELPPGEIGALALIFTNDGSTYFPTVFALVPGGPAKEAGLRTFDMILSADGSPLANKTYREVEKVLAGQPGTPVSLLVWRTGQTLTLQVRRAHTDEIFEFLHR